jgi:hypothetical protein
VLTVCSDGDNKGSRQLERRPVVIVIKSARTGSGNSGSDDTKLNHDVDRTESWLDVVFIQIQPTL